MRVRRLLAVLAVTTLTAGAGVVAMGGAPTGAAATTGYTVVWSDGGCQLSTIDLATAAVVPIGATSQTSCVRDLAVSPEGVVYGLLSPLTNATEVDLVRFDTTTGAATNLGPITGSFDTTIGNNGGIAFAPDGTLLATFAANESGCVPSASVCLYRVDPATLVATLIGPAGQADNPFFYLTASCAGSTLSTEFVERGFTSESDGAVGAANGLSNQQLASWNGSPARRHRGAALPSNFDVGGLEYDRVPGTLYALGLELDGQSTTSPDSAEPAAVRRRVALHGRPRDGRGGHRLQRPEHRARRRQPGDPRHLRRTGSRRAPAPLHRLTFRASAALRRGGSGTWTRRAPRVSRSCDWR